MSDTSRVQLDMERVYGEGIGLRGVRECVLGGVRRGRDLYSEGELVGGDLLVWADGNGDLVDMGVEEEVSLESLGGGFYRFSDVLVGMRNKELLEGGMELLYGGSMLYSEVERSSVLVRYVGPRIMWTRNEGGRVRFSEGGELLGGVLGRVGAGRVGDEGVVLAGVSGYLVLEGLGMYEIGGGEILLVSDVAGHEFGGGELGVVGIESGELRWGVSSGESVYYVRGDLLGEAAGGYVSIGGESYLSPVPRGYEYVLLREEGYGYLGVEYVGSDDELLDLGRGRVCISLESGKFLYVGRLRYEGLVLGVGVGCLSVSDGGVVSSLWESGISEVSDGGGLGGLRYDLEFGACSFVLRGREAIPVEVVEELPRRLVSGRVYYRRGDMGLVGMREGDRFVQHMYMLRMGWGGGDYIYAQEPGGSGGELWGLGGYRRGEGLSGVSFLSEAGLLSGLCVGFTSEGLRGYSYYELESWGQGVRAGLGAHILPNLDLLRREYAYMFSVSGEEVSAEFVVVEGRVSKLEWLSARGGGGVISEPLGLLELPAGARNISVELSGVGEGIEPSILSTGMGVMWKQVYGAKKGEGFGHVLSESEFDLGVELGGLAVGDFISYDGYYRRVLGISGTAVELSSMGVEINGRVFGVGYISESGVWEAFGGGDGLVDGMVLSGECFKGLDLGLGGVVVRKGRGDLSGLLKPLGEGSRRVLRGQQGRVYLEVLADRVLDGFFVDLGDPHTAVGEYEILVNGVSVEYAVDEETGELSFAEPLQLGDEVVYRARPMEREGYAECYSDGSGLVLPEGFGDVLAYEEELASTQYAVQRDVVSFFEGLESGVGVSVQYPTSDGSVVSVVEEEIIFLRDREEALGSGTEYVFNPAGIEVSLDVPVVVYVGVEPQAGGYRLDLGLGKIFFTREPSGRVFISYGVLGAVGGEFLVKLTGSVELPSVSLAAGATSMSVGGDTSELVEGVVISLGAGVLRFVTSVEGGVVNFTPALSANMRVTEVFYTTSADIFLSVSGYISAAPKASKLVLGGDMTGLVYEGVLLSMGGGVYAVKSSELVGTETRVVLDGIVPSGFTGDEYAISVRPIPYEGGVQIGKRGLVISRDDEYVLVREESGLGRLLVEKKDYVLDFETGSVSLRGGYDVRGGVRYTLRHSALRVLGPYLSNGLLKFPSYSISYDVNTAAPDRYVGKKVSFTGVVEKREKYYLRDVLESEYVGEVAADLLREGGSLTSGGKAPLGIAPNIYAKLGRDVVARNRIKFYDAVISSVDDILSSMTGRVVGDTDGRFKFELDPAPYWGGAGLEDMITRRVLLRNVFEELGLDLSDLTSEGIESALLRQKKLIRNEMDDQVLVGVRSVRELTLTYPFLRLVVSGVYRQMWESHRLSRLYPQGGLKHLSVLLDGNFGYSSRGAVIGRIENPALGEITGITSASLSKRVARFRVWDYAPNGFPEEPSTLGKPTFILSAVELRDFPLDALGQVDTSRLVYFGNEEGDIASVESGNPELAFRGLSAGDTIELGRSGGSMEPVFLTSDEVVVADPFVGQSLARARVLSIVKGAYVVVSGRGSTLTRGGVTFLSEPPLRGDTFTGSLTGDIDEGVNNSYTIGVDVGLNSATGELINIARSSISDPNFPWREITNQNIPEPLTAIEGSVSFIYGKTEPFEYPALRGEATDDSGDVALPYRASDSERDTLASISVGIRSLLSSQVGGAYEYPDEIRENAVSITEGVLELSKSLTPFSDGDIASKDVEGGDLVLISPVEGDGSTGFLEVSVVEGQEIIPPFFATSTSEGAVVKYALRNAIYDTAATITDTYYVDGVGNYDYSDISISCTSQLFDLLTKLSTQSGDYVELALSYDSALIGVLTISSLGAGGLTAEYHDEQSGLDFGPVAVRTWYELGGALIIRCDLETGSGQSNPSFAESVLRSFFDVIGVGSAPHPDGVEYFVESVGVVGNVEFLTTGSSTARILEDRLTLQEPSAVVTQGAVLSGDDRLVLVVGTCEFPVYETGNEVSAGYITSDINATSTNVRDMADAYSFRVYGLASGKTLISSPARDLSVWVTRRAGLFSGECEVGSLELGAGNTAEEMSRGKLVPTDEGAGLEQVLPGDLAYVVGSHASGVSRVLGAISESVSEQEISLRLGASPSIVSVSEVGGSYFLECTDNMSKYYDYSTAEGNPISVSVDPVIALLWDGEVLSSATPAQGGILVSGVVISGDLTNTEIEVPAGAAVTYLDGTGVGGLSLSEILTGGREFIGFNKLPFDISATGLAGFSAPCSIESAHMLVTSSFGGGLTDEMVVSELGVSTLELAFTRDTMGRVSDFSLRNHYLMSTTIGGYIQAGGVGLALRAGDVLKIKVSVSRGIYLDPEFPRLGLDYGRAFSNYFELSDEYGSVSASDYMVSHALVGGYVERAQVSIGRLRRFTTLFERLSADLKSLAPLYQQREGVVRSISQDGMSVVLEAEPVNYEGVVDPTGGDTQIGGFVDVVNEGDDVFLYEAGAQVAKLRVISVESGVLRCRYIYGDIPLVVAGHTFRVWTRSGVVPQGQSYDDFIGVAFTEVFTSTSGGVDTLNELSDRVETLVEAGIAVDDYIVIDPAGELDSPSEMGSPAKGDTGKEGQAEYEVGVVSPYDDNRGVYKITGISGEGVVSVEPVYPHEGIDSAGYNFLPSVGGSDWGTLRVTAASIGGSHNDPLNAEFSIEPFSYRVLRKNSGISQELAEDMLFFRERMLSWSEKVSGFGLIKTSTWESYVAEGLVEYVGEMDITHPSNQELLGFEGNIEMTPDLVTTYDCLSLLERRFMGEDTALGFLGFSEIAPSVPALLEDAMSFMGAREKRLSWISVRTNPLNGTLAEMARVSFDNITRAAIKDLS